MKYTGRFVKDDLIRVILPPIDSILLFQDANFLAILSITGSHARTLETLAPIGSPKYVKGIEPVLHLKVVAACCNQI